MADEEWEKRLDGWMETIDKKIDRVNEAVYGNGGAGIKSDLRSLITIVKRLAMTVEDHHDMLYGEGPEDHGIRGAVHDLNNRQEEQEEMVKAIQKLFWAAITTSIVGLVNFLFWLVKLVVEKGLSF